MTDGPTTATNYGDPATYHQLADYPLSEGDVVYDIRQLVTSTEPGATVEEAVVVDTLETDVRTKSFERNGVETVLADYDLNRIYSDFEASERVVTIAWASLLDGLVAQWREHRGNPADMVAYFDEMQANWDVSVRAHQSTYDYPESRLIQAERVPDGALE